MFFSDTKKLLDALKYHYKLGISYDTDFIESLVAHEMGHNVHVALALKRAKLQYGKPLSTIDLDIFSRNYNEISQEIYICCFEDEKFDEI